MVGILVILIERPSVDYPVVVRAIQGLLREESYKNEVE